MPDRDKPDYPDPREEDIVYGDRRISRPDVSLPDWEVPDTAYRPIPIVWFTGAFFVHVIAGALILIITPDRFPTIGSALCAIATLAVGKWTWERGMSQAGFGWKLATVIMLGFNLLYLTALAHSP